MALKRKTVDNYVGVEGMARVLGVGRARVLQLMDEYQIPCISVDLRGSGRAPFLAVRAEDFKRLQKERAKGASRRTERRQAAAAQPPAAVASGLQQQINEVGARFGQLENRVEQLMDLLAATLIDEAEQAGAANDDLAVRQLPHGTNGASLGDPGWEPEVRS